MDYESILDAGGTAGAGASGATGGTAGGLGGSGATSGAAGSGATGGSGATAGASGSGAIGGSGGSTAACKNIALDGAPIGFETSPWTNQWPPLFAPLDATGPRIAVAVEETPLDNPTDEPGELRITTLDAWGEWPNGSLGSGEYPDFVVGARQVAMDRGEIDGRVAVAYPGTPTPPAPNPTGLFFTTNLDPASPTGSLVNDITTQPADQHLVRFVRYGYWGHLVGLQRGSAGHYKLDLTFVNVESPSGIPFANVGCGATPIEADAAPVPTGFVFAFSSSREFDGCQLNDGADGVPGLIHVGLFTNLGLFFSQLPVGFAKNDVVQFIRVIPHSGGAWLVFQYAGLNGDPYPAPPPIQAMRFDEQGTVLDGPVSLDDIGNPYMEPAVGRLGDQLVIGWLDVSEPPEELIRLVVVGDGAEVTAVTSLPLPNPGSHFSSLRLMGSPSGDQVIVGWTHYAAGEDVYTEARVARFSCY